MDEFGVFILGAVIVLFVVFYALGKYYPGSGAEQVDWRPARSPEVEAELELEDMDQMLEAQNERRRRSGRPELTEDDMREQVARAEAEQNERAARYKANDPGAEL
jgi:hypothetical protein